MISRPTRHPLHFLAAALLIAAASTTVSGAPAPVFHLDFSAFEDLSPNHLTIDVGDAVTLVPNGGPLLAGGRQLNAANWEGIEDDTNQIIIDDNPILDAVATGAGSIVAWIKPNDGDEWNNIAKTPCEEHIEPCDAFGEFRGIEFQASGPHAGVFGAVQGWYTNNFGPDSPPPFGNGNGDTDTPSGEWTHVALVWNEQGDHTAFVSGVPGTTVLGVGDEEFGLNEPDYWTIGGDGLGTNQAINPDALRYLNGDLADFAIYNQALTAADLAEIMRNGVASALPGDFNRDGVLNGQDIDDLTHQSATGTDPPAYDLNADAKVNEGDIRIWVKDLFKSWIGDANLNREFNSSDLVAVLASGTYEADVDAVWTSGDFTGDGRTNSSDLVAALADGGYELGPPPPAATAVPEPTALALLLLGVACLVARRRA